LVAGLVLLVCVLDPFEKQLHLPAAAVEIGNRDGRKGEIVC
jgi:hypothetical protein